MDTDALASMTVAEWLLTIAQSCPSSITDELVSNQKVKTQKELAQISAEGRSKRPVFATDNASTASFSRQFWELAAREGRYLAREWFATLVMALLFSLGFTLMATCLWWNFRVAALDEKTFNDPFALNWADLFTGQLPDEISAASIGTFVQRLVLFLQGRISLTIMLLTVLANGAALNETLRFAAERPTFLREYSSARMYSIFPFFMSKLFVAELPLVLLRGFLGRERLLWLIGNGDSRFQYVRPVSSIRGSAQSMCHSVSICLG